MKKSSYKIPTVRDIIALNTLYNQCSSCADELSKAYAAWDKRRDDSVAITTLRKKYMAASAKFDDFKHRLDDAVKFDIEKGEYFPAFGENGLENYRIKVTLMQSQTMNISAENYESARKIAKEAFAKGKLKSLSPIQIVCEDISR